MKRQPFLRARKTLGSTYHFDPDVSVAGLSREGPLSPVQASV
jgi:hypothetical protein